MIPNFSSVEFEKKYTYTKNDLGAVWKKDKTIFRVWAPTAEKMHLNIYKSGDNLNDDLIKTIEMSAGEKGTWLTEVSGNLDGIYYTFNGVCDPYARAVGVNGNRAMVIDLVKTNPIGWENDKNPNSALSPTEAIIYELHVKDFSCDENSGFKHKGKYLAFTEKGADYLANLGITHLQLLPVFDFGSVDETKSDGYNWGYDPKNFNVPEGSYSTNAYSGGVRIKEFKQMVQSLHKKGISVIMDVVYNHTHDTDFCFNKLVPNYFFRGSSNGSGCGNDVATERSMVREYIVKSVLYWAKECHIDGFRFDLAGLIDTRTINEIRKKLPSAILYGEGWTMNTKPTKKNIRLATQINSSKTGSFAYFNDNTRDALKGSVFSATDKGYINGANHKIEEIKRAVQGLPTWAQNPVQVINYTSCHDNLTLWDKINSSNANDTFEERVLQNKLATAIMLTSQGIAFIHAGEEMLRTKNFVYNSYNSSGEINYLKWENLNRYIDVYDYYKGLIAFRKSNPDLHLKTADEVRNSICFLPVSDENIIAFLIKNRTLVIYNPNRSETKVTLPNGGWGVYINDKKAGNNLLEKAQNTVTVKPISCMVLLSIF